MATDLNPSLQRRRVVGAATLPLLFVCVMATNLIDKIDDSGSAAHQIRQAHEHLSTLRPLAILDLLAAALGVGVIATFLDAVRGRGRIWVNVAALIGALGVAGQALIGAHQLFLYALASYDLANAAAVSKGLDNAAGPIAMLFFALPAALVLFGIGAWRADLIPTPGLALVLLFVLTNAVPAGGPLELIGLLIGLAAFGWIGLALLRQQSLVSTQVSPAQPVAF